MSRPLQLRKLDKTRIVDAENGWCLRANRVCERNGLLRYFAAVSRLGDGVFWYLLMGALVAFDGIAGILGGTFDRGARVLGGGSGRVGGVRRALGGLVARGGGIIGNRTGGFRSFFLGLFRAGGEAEGRDGHRGEDDLAHELVLSKSNGRGAIGAKD